MRVAVALVALGCGRFVEVDRADHRGGRAFFETFKPIDEPDPR